MVATIIGECVMLETSQDKMEVRAIFTEPENGGEILNFEDFLRVVNRENFYGYIDGGYLKKLFNNRKNEPNPIILTGRLPVNGNDGVIHFHFDTSGKIGYDGEVQSVYAGQILATIIPGEAGIDGVNVYGQRLPARKGKMPTFPRGRNTEISEDRFSLYSKIDGRVEYVNSKVNVDKAYVVDGDLDKNISFVGDVIVKGNVLSKYSIKAEGNVEVYGVVEGASIEAAGDIYIRKGIVGAKRCTVKSGANVTSKFIEHATVYAKGDVTVDVILHGNVNAQGDVIVKGRKGQVIGGSVRAGGNITAQSIGTFMHIPTYLEVGIDIARMQQCNQFEKKIKELRNSAPNYKRLRSMPTVLKKEIDDLLDKYRECKEKEYLDNNSSISAVKEIYPGTTIVIRGISKTLNEALVNTTFILSGSDIVEKIHIS